MRLVYEVKMPVLISSGQPKLNFRSLYDGES